jgi:hypothetical protein
VSVELPKRSGDAPTYPRSVRARYVSTTNRDTRCSMAIRKNGVVWVAWYCGAVLQPHHRSHPPGYAPDCTWLDVNARNMLRSWKYLSLEALRLYGIDQRFYINESYIHWWLTMCKLTKRKMGHGNKSNTTPSRHLLTSIYLIAICNS